MSRRRSPFDCARDRELVEDAIAAVRHDIRNKLASVRQAAHYLKTRSQGTELWQEDPRVPRFFALIDTELESANELFAKHEVLDRIHERRPVPLSPLAIATESARLCAEGARVTIEVVADGRPVADEAELVVALTALLDDALARNGTGSVSVRGASRGRLYCFAVSGGISTLDRASFRAALRNALSGSDSALFAPLSTATRIANRYGGTVELGEDALTVELSIGQQQDSSRANGKLGALLGSPRVLLVDDDESTRLTVAAVLEDEGFEVSTASSKVEVEDLTQTEDPFRVAFVDYHLEDALGTELVATIRSHSPEGFVVLVSGDDAGPLPPGVDRWIVKGGDPSILVQAARECAAVASRAKAP